MFQKLKCDVCLTDQTSQFFLFNRQLRKPFDSLAYLFHKRLWLPLKLSLRRLHATPKTRERFVTRLLLTPFLCALLLRRVALLFRQRRVSALFRIRCLAVAQRLVRRCLSFTRFLDKRLSTPRSLTLLLKLLTHLREFFQSQNHTTLSRRSIQFPKRKRLLMGRRKRTSLLQRHKQLPLTSRLALQLPLRRRYATL